MDELTQMDKCRNHFFIEEVGDWCGLLNDQTSINKCSSCDAYDCKYTEFPIQVNDVNLKMWDREDNPVCKKCKLKITAQKQKEEIIYDAVFLGEKVNSATVTFNKFGVMTVIPIRIPLFFIPELMMTVWGYECAFWFED